RPRQDVAILIVRIVRLVGIFRRTGRRVVLMEDDLIFGNELCTRSRIVAIAGHTNTVIMKSCRDCTAQGICHVSEGRPSFGWYALTKVCHPLLTCRQRFKDGREAEIAPVWYRTSLNSWILVLVTGRIGSTASVERRRLSNELLR